jgi:predicted RNase H-like HicB family nuclease
MPKRRKRLIQVPLTFLAVCWHEDGNWIAHHEAFDLYGHGATPEKATEMLGLAIKLQIGAAIAVNNPANLFA